MSSSDYFDDVASQWDEMRSGFYSANARDAALAAGRVRDEHHDRWMGFGRSDLATWFGAAGLSGVSVQDVGENCLADSPCGTESASVIIFVASGVK